MNAPRENRERCGERHDPKGMGGNGLCYFVLTLSLSLSLSVYLHNIYAAIQFKGRCQVPNAMIVKVTHK